MDLTGWDVNPVTNGVNIRMFFDDFDTEWVFVPEWMATAFANAILGDLEFARRTRRDEGRQMRIAVPSGQVFCEPCYLEIDVNLPAITRAPDETDESVLECCCCRFRKPNREETGDCSPVPCSMGFDQESDTE